jgi:hypothetical protein
MRHMKVLALVGLVGVTACASGERETLTASDAGVVDKTTPRASALEPTAAPAETAPTTAPAPIAPPSTPAPLPPLTTAAPEMTPETGLNPLGGNAPEDALMPSVLCMNLQEAQDEIQDHGVFLSRSEDATGEGRMQINDSNWQVVAQMPEPGQPIGEGDAVLFVVKYDDNYPNPC